MDGKKKPTLLRLRQKTSITTQQLAFEAGVSLTEAYVVEIGGFVVGGALYYVQIGLAEQDLKGNLAHRHAAIFTARTIIDRNMRYLLRLWSTEKARWKKEYPGLTQSTLYRVRRRSGIQIRPEQAKGQPIPLAQFFLLPPPYNRMEEFPSWLNVTAFRPTESVDQSLWLKSYPRAFLDPPYGLLWQRENTRPENLFQAINQEIFNDDINLFTVYQ